MGKEGIRNRHTKNRHTKNRHMRNRHTKNRHIVPGQIRYACDEKFAVTFRTVCGN